MISLDVKIFRYFSSDWRKYVNERFIFRQMLASLEVSPFHAKPLVVSRLDRASMNFSPPYVPRSRPPLSASRGLFELARRWWNQKRQRGFLMGISLVVLFYSGAVLCEIIWTGDIGVRCSFRLDPKKQRTPISPVQMISQRTAPE